MSTFDEVIKELRGGVKVAVRHPGSYVRVDRGSFVNIVDGMPWVPNQLEMFAENWVIYDSRAEAEMADMGDDDPLFRGIETG